MEIPLPHNYRPRAYQELVYRHFVPDPFRKRADVLAHRRWGKDLLALNIVVPLTQQRVGTYWHVLPYAKQARAVVWNGKDKKGRSFRSYVPRELIDHTIEQEMRVHLKNGSIYQCIGADDIDRHVGTNPVGVVLSEWSLMNPLVYDYIRPILRENDGWCLRIFTVRGENHAWKGLLRTERLMTTNPNYLAVNQTVEHTFDESGKRVISDEDIDEERASGLSERLIQQEFYNNPTVANEGAYYAHELMAARSGGRICSVPYDPKALVDTYWDIGYGDFTVIIFMQEIGKERHVIDCYANSGEEVGHYASVMEKKEYNYGRHYGPWDVEQKHLAAGGKSVWDVAKAHGIKFIVTPQPRHVTDGIEQVRNIFPSLWFDDKKCERLLDAIADYQKEPLADHLQRSGRDDDEPPAFKDKPLHSWSSHYCDALRVMAWHVKKKPSIEIQRTQNTVTEDDFQYV